MKKSLLSLLLICCLILFSKAQTIDLKLEILNPKTQVDSILKLSHNVLVEDFDATERWLIKLLAYTKEIKSPNDIANILEKKSLISYYKGNYKLSTLEALSAIRIFDSLNNKSAVANLYASLGYQLKRVNLNEAENYMIKGIKMSELMNDKKTLTSSYNNYGVIKEMKNELDSALYFYSTSKRLTTELNDSLGISYALNNIGGVYLLQDDYDQSIMYVKEALSIRENLHHKHGIIECYNFLGDIYLHFNKIEEAISVYEKSLKGSYEIKYPYLRQQNFEKLAQSYAKQKDFKNAFTYNEKFIQLKDSLRGAETNKEIAQLKEQFDSNIKDREISHQNDVIEKDSNLKILLYALIGAILTLSTLFYFWYKSKQKQKLQSELLKEKERGLAGIISAQEDERKRIAKELHDGIVQELTSLKFGLKKTFETEFTPEIETLFQQLEASTTDLRKISHQMMPTALTQLGVAEAIEDMLHKSLNPLDIQFHFETFGITDRLKESFEITLYRVSQELINNVVKHSEAKEVNVQLYKSGINIILVIEDNGKGISKNAKTDGIGLMNITSRLNTIKGQINFESSPNNGTLATIKIPLDD